MSIESKPRTKRRIDRQTVVNALIERARTTRSSEVSFRELGNDLGVDGSAIYRHFRDKDELFRAALDQLYGEALDRIDPSVSSWRARLEEHFRSLSEVFLEAPAVGQLAPFIDGRGPGELRGIEFILQAVRDAGLQGREAIDAYAAITGHSLAYAASMAREAARGQGDAAMPWIKTLDVAKLSDFPRVSEDMDALLALSTQEVFKAGADAILDAIEQRSLAAGRSR